MSSMFGEKGGDESEEEDEIVKGQNLFLIFGCAANKGVPATSKIATQFFEVLQQAQDENGVILLPDPKNVFSFWTPNEQETYSGEKILKHNRILHFSGDLSETELLDEETKAATNQDEGEEEKGDSQFP